MPSEARLGLRRRLKQHLHPELLPPVSGNRLCGAPVRVDTIHA